MKSIGTPKKVKVSKAKNLYKDGDVLTIPFKLGKNLQLSLPAGLTKYLTLHKKAKLYCAVIGGTLQLVANKPITTIPVATEDLDIYESHSNS